MLHAVCIGPLVQIGGDKSRHQQQYDDHESEHAGTPVFRMFKLTVQPACTTNSTTFHVNPFSFRIVAAVIPVPAFAVLINGFVRRSADKWGFVADFFVLTGQLFLDTVGSRGYFLY